MPKGIGSIGKAIGVTSVCLTLACATTPWPDEPGTPVALAQSDNLQASEAFLTALTVRRRSENLSAPLVAPRYQAEIRIFAEDLQAGKTSVAGARRAIAAWAQAAYQRNVITFAIDCSMGEQMEVPSKLVELPSAVVSYAAAHFRPRSVAKEQCAVLVAALVGTESVERTNPALP